MILQVRNHYCFGLQYNLAERLISCKLPNWITSRTAILMLQLLFYQKTVIVMQPQLTTQSWPILVQLDCIACPWKSYYWRVRQQSQDKKTDKSKGDKINMDKLSIKSSIIGGLNTQENRHSFGLLKSWLSGETTHSGHSNSKMPHTSPTWQLLLASQITKRRIPKKDNNSREVPMEVESHNI